MADEEKSLRQLEKERLEREADKAAQTEQRALASAKEGDIVLVREALNGKKEKEPAGTILKESEEWSAARIQHMLNEGHAKMKGAEVKTGDAKEGFMAGAARRLGGGEPGKDKK